MINEVKKVKSPVLFSNKKIYVPDAVVDTKAVKKNTICTMIDEGSQLTMLAVLVEQLGDMVGLDTPEFTQAKQVFAGIKSVLA